MHFILLWKIIYIYYVEIQLYIIYGIQEPLGIFSPVRAQYLPLFLRGGGAGQQELLGDTRGQFRETGSLSRSPGGVGAPAKRVSLGPAWADSGSLVFLRDDAGLRTVFSNGRLLRQSWCHGPGLMRAGPSGEEWGTPHYTVPVSPQCPQEISLLTLPVFQGAAVSSEHFSQSLQPKNVADLGGSPPLRGSLEQLDRPSPASPPLQGTELAALSTPEASLERLVPLVDYLAAWKLLSNVSRWIIYTVEQGYCGVLPQPFNGVTSTLVGPEQALVMEQEVSTLLRKEAIEVVPPLDKEAGFYSRTSLFLGKGWRPFWI